MSPHTLDVTAVLIADIAPHHETLTIENNDLEFMSDRYYNDVMGALSAVCSGVVHYHSPSEFMDNIAKHKDHVVLSVWSGVNSRNRRGLVPSICEAYNIPYVGADTYTQIVCQDKALAKRYAKQFGFPSPQGQLIADRAGLERIRLLKPPLVVKPNFEGGSIGISQSNLVNDHPAAEDLCAKLLDLYPQSVLVEEFIPGREVSIVYAGNATDIWVMEPMELFFEEDPEVIQNIVLGYETKKAGGLGPLKKRSITNEFPSEVLEAGRALFTALDKVEVLRIDGRYSDGRFTVVELSPDAHLGKNATVARAFDAAGYSYEEMFEKLLSNAQLSRTR